MATDLDTAEGVIHTLLAETPDAPSPIHISGDSTPSAIVRILSALAYCCEGAATYGPHRCTCWTAEYDIDQEPPDTTTVAGAQTEMCADCAYRPGSPERSGDDRYDHAVDEDGEGGPLALVDAGQPFWCHQGMRKPVRWRHDTLGIVVEADADGYDPPKAGGIPYRADGTAGLLCAGWLARTLRARQLESAGG